jgi:uridine kinase
MEADVAMTHQPASPDVVFVDAPDDVRLIRRIERDYHVRAFGEELARVNLDMTKAERHRYLAWMRQTARAHGVKPAK